jgi:hypothetical protein
MGYLGAVFLFRNVTFLPLVVLAGCVSRPTVTDQDEDREQGEQSPSLAERDGACSPMPSELALGACEAVFASCLHSAEAYVLDCRGTCHSGTCAAACDQSGVGKVRLCQEQLSRCSNGTSGP